MDTNRKLDALKIIAEEIRLELKIYKERKSLFILLVQDAAEISSKAGHFEQIT